MMTFEPKCVMWKRLGAEQVQKQIEGLSFADELEFWRKQTEALKARQQRSRDQMPNLAIQSDRPPPVFLV